MMARVTAFVFFLSLAGVPESRAGEFDFQAGADGATDFSGPGAGIDAGAGLGSSGRANMSGASGGAHVGYNFQASRFVAGAEADILATNIKSGGFGATSYRQDYLSSVKAKGGWIFGDILPYGAVGLARSATAYQDASGLAKRNLNGVVYGVGAELSITRNISIRAEYLRYAFGRQTYQTPGAAVPLGVSTNIVRVGAGLRF